MNFSNIEDKPDGKKTILCLDDDSITLKLLEYELKRLFDTHVVTFTSSFVALEYLENHTVDVIIEDIVRPEMDGWNFLSIMRKSERLKDIPVLIITSMSLDDDFVDKAEKFNANYTSKPWCRVKFKEKIIEMLDNKSYPVT